MIKNELPIIKRFFLSTASVIVITLVLLSSLLTANAAYTGSYVNDAAGLFTAEEIKMLNDEIQQAYNTHRIGLFVLTTNDIGSKNSMEYADDYHDKLIDDEGFPVDSALMLFDMDSRVMWISTTGQMIDAVDDAAIDRILDEAVNPAKDCDFYTAASNFVNHSGIYYFNFKNTPGEKYTEIYGDDWDNVIDMPGEVIGGSAESRFIFPAVGAVIVFIIVIFVVGNRYKNNGIAGASPNMHRTNLRLTKKSDVLVSKTVTHTVINTPPPPKGGSGSHSTGFSSSSHTHVSSGGHSHGGGGRGF